jgi:hypothetical protein
MAKQAKKQTKKAKKVQSATFVATEPKPENNAAPVQEKPAKKTPQVKAFEKAKASENLDALRSAAETVQAALKDAEAKADDMRHEADTLVRNARGAFMVALVPYKAACKKAGVACEFKAKRSPVAERVHFLVEKADDGVKVEISGRAETAELLDSKTLKKSIMKAASGYCEKHLGSKETVGAKYAGLYNRIRKVLGKME